MVYINRHRRANEDGRRRQEQLQSAESLDGRRGQFIDWMKYKGFSRDQMDRELNTFDKVVEERERLADQSQVDLR